METPDQQPPQPTPPGKKPRKKYGKPKRRNSRGNAMAYSGRWKVAFIEALEKTGNVTAAAEFAVIDKTTAYNHKDKDPKFRRQWEEALETATDRLELEARRRAEQGLVQKKFTKSGDPIIDPETGKQYFERVYSDSLLMFLLKGHRPDKYGEKKDAAPIDVAAFVEANPAVATAEVPPGAIPALAPPSPVQDGAGGSPVGEDGNRQA